LEYGRYGLFFSFSNFLCNPKIHENKKFGSPTGQPFLPLLLRRLGVMLPRGAAAAAHHFLFRRDWSEHCFNIA
jgi:hypothetical protein